MTRNPHKNPNPQGKGLVPVLQDWQSTRANGPAKKTAVDLVRDWFVSTLVLSAEFRFRPVVGQRYFLYCGDRSWSLSLVGPEEWRRSPPGVCLGECALLDDMTWNLDVRPESLESTRLRAILGELVTGFTASLEGEEKIVDMLPGYRRELPYHQRMLATGLGASLKHSGSHTDILEGPGTALLTAAAESLPRALAHLSGQDVGEPAPDVDV